MGSTTSRVRSSVLSLTVLTVLLGAAIPAAGQAQSGAKRPNIVVIFGDDVGQSNISAYSRGLMGFTTPNIDRIGNEGGVFVTYYGQQAAPPAARHSLPGKRRSAPV